MDDHTLITIWGEHKWEKAQQGFTQLHNQTFFVHVLPKVGKGPSVLYLYMLSLAYGDKVYAFPGRRKILNDLNISETTLDAWISRLEWANIMRRVPCVDRYGGNTPNVYLLNAYYPEVPDGWSEFAPCGFVMLRINGKMTVMLREEFETLTSEIPPQKKSPPLGDENVPQGWGNKLGGGGGNCYPPKKTKKEKSKEETQINNDKQVTVVLEELTEMLEYILKEKLPRNVLVKLPEWLTLYGTGKLMDWAVHARNNAKQNRIGYFVRAVEQQYVLCDVSGSATVGKSEQFDVRYHSYYMVCERERYIRYCHANPTYQTQLVESYGPGVLISLEVTSDASC